MINVIASIEVKECELEKFLQTFKPNINRVLSEKGCIEYLPTMDFDVNDSCQVFQRCTITILEKWKTIEDLNAHAVAPHMLAHQERVKNLVVGVTIKALKEF